MMPELATGEMDALVDAFYAVLVLVAAADGEVDPKEEKRFAELLAAAAQTTDPLRTVVETARANVPGPNRFPKLSRADALDRVRAGVKVAEDKFDADSADRFKEGLLKMGRAIAEASGGTLFGLGKRKSQEEEDALVVLAACLGLDGR
jgi:tellurite resistance protein